MALGDPNLKSETEPKPKTKPKHKSKDERLQLAAKGITPYQGTGCCFGRYRCEDCAIEWTSARSWANTWQLCKTCGKEVYAFMQWPKERRKGDSNEEKHPPHPRELCGKCQKLKAPCWLQKSPKVQKLPNNDNKKQARRKPTQET